MASGCGAVGLPLANGCRMIGLSATGCCGANRLATGNASDELRLSCACSGFGLSACLATATAGPGLSDESTSGLA